MAELTKLTGTYIKEGSIPTTALSGGVVSSSLQIVNALPTGSVSSSAQVTALLPADVVSSSGQVTAFLPSNTVSSSGQVTAFLPTDTVSSSVQVTTFLPTGTVSSSGQLPTGIASSSAQVIAYLPTDTVSSSGQVTAFLPTNTVSSSGQVTAFLPTGTVSQSSQVDFATISNKPTLVSQSSQVNVFSTTGGDTIATTGSNTFTGVTTFSDTTNSTSYLDGAVHVAGGMSVRKDIRVSGSMTINGLLTVVSMSSQYVTSSQYNIGVSKVTVNDDDNVRFAGLSVVDSGSSSPATASIFWDSLQHRFIYENLSGSSYNSAILMAGPKNTGSLGDEVGLTTGYIPYATGEDHIDNSIIFQSQSNIGIGTTNPDQRLVVYATTGSLMRLSVPENQGSFDFGTDYHIQNTGQTLARISSYLLSSNDLGYGGLLFSTRNGAALTERIRITNAGNVGIGTTNPNRLLDIRGQTQIITNSEYQLDVQSSTSAAGASVRKYSTSAYAYDVYESADGAGRHWRTGILGSLSYTIYDNTAAAARITIDTSGNVGIGKTNPGGKLHVVGENVIIDRASGDPFLEFYTSGTTNNVSVYGGASTGFRVFTGGSERIRISGSGNVGIGTTNPTARLEIGEASGIVARLSRITSGNNIDINYYNPISTAGDIARIRVDGDGISNLYGAISFWTTQTPNSLVERARITSGGNVGIGTTNPTSLWSGDAKVLHVSASGTTAAGVRVASSRANVEFYSSGTTDNWGFYTTANMPFSLYTNNVERIRVTGDGNVGIGTTNPANKLQIGSVGSSGYGGNDLVIGNGTQVMAFYVYSGGPSAWFTNTHFALLSSGAGSTGNVGIGTTDPSTTTLSVLRGTSGEVGRFRTSATDSVADLVLVNDAQTWGFRVDGATSDNFVIRNFQTSTDVVHIKTSGNVGIGTTSPVNKLDIYDSVGATTLRLLNLYGVSTGLYGYSRIIGLTGGNGLFLSQNVSGSSGGNNPLDDTAQPGQAISIGQNYGGIAFVNYSAGAGTRTANVSMFINNSGNVGIGTTNPSEKLHVNGANATIGIYDPTISVGGNKTYIKMGYNSNYIAGLSSYVAAGKAGVDRVNLGFHVTTYTTSTQTFYEAMTITDIGNVGIGTTNPSILLHVKKAAIGDWIAAFDNTGTSPYGVRVDTSANSSTNYSLAVYTAAGTGFYVKNDGSVGIGITDPASYSAKLTVAGNVAASAGNNLRVWESTNTTYVQMNSPASREIRWTNDAGTEYMRINASGNVGIGTASPDYRLTILTPTSDATIGFNLRAYATGADGDRTVISRYTSSNNNNWAWSEYHAWAHIWKANGVEQMRLNSSGNVGIGTTNPGSYKLYVQGDQYISGTLTEASSIVLKENINPITDALSIISNLTGYTYDRKDGTAKNQAGLIAEEVEQTLPNVVSYDSDGHASGVQYTKIIAYLVESIKELKKELDSLRK